MITFNTDNSSGMDGDQDTSAYYNSDRTTCPSDSSYINFQSIRDFGIASNKAARDSIIYSQQNDELNGVLEELGIEVL